MKKAPNKIYVKETVEKNTDGEKLQVVNVYQSHVNDHTYLIFTKK